MSVPALPARLQARAADIQLVVLDVDGVLTDGRLFYSDQGEAHKAFDVRDGLGIRLAQHAGVELAIITGRTSEMVADRASELDIEEVHQGIHRKGDCLQEIMERRGFHPKSVAVLGDDIIDLPAMAIASISAAPADAVKEVRDYVDHVLFRDGGRGAVREFLDALLHAAGTRDAVIRKLGLHGGDVQ